MELTCVIRLSKTGLITSITWLQNALCLKRLLSGLMGTGCQTTMKYPSVYFLDGEGAANYAFYCSFVNAGKRYHAKMIHNAHIPALQSSQNPSRKVEEGCQCATSTRFSEICQSHWVWYHHHGWLSASDTIPFNEIHNSRCFWKHEAKDLRFLKSNSITSWAVVYQESEATEMIVMGFVEFFTKELPMEYAVELNWLIRLRNGICRLRR